MSKISRVSTCLCAILVPVCYLLFYTAYGMDTTDFGYFYAYAWRILEGQIPYRDFFYIKPAFPLYWHAFWLNLSPENLRIILGKAGFVMEMLGAAWFGALYLSRLFDLRKLRVPLPLLATTGFVFGIHTFPHMPWHTADGALFSSAALFSTVICQPALGGVMAALATLCKQSFILLPVAILFYLFLKKIFNQIISFAVALIGVYLLSFMWLKINGAWDAFREMTTGQLDIREALDAGIWIYFRQNWALPLAACLPWLGAKILKKNCPGYLLPCFCYIILLGCYYIYEVFRQKTWIGYGMSWPTLFVILGAVEIFFPKIFLLPWKRDDSRNVWVLSFGLGMGMVAVWSCAISGGYKIPAFLAVISFFCFLLIHAKMRGNVARLVWVSLFTGVVMFAAGFQYPYVFPQRELRRADMTYHAGDIFPAASHVYVDKDMYERLRELKELREKYGANYKTLPGFTLAHFLLKDHPTGLSDWLIDWEINGEVQKVYDDLLQNDVIIFMERDQAETAKADNYDRAGYGVPQIIRHAWRIIDQTPHFIVFRKPMENNAKPLTE